MNFHRCVWLRESARCFWLLNRKITSSQYQFDPSTNYAIQIAVLFLLLLQIAASSSRFGRTIIDVFSFSYICILDAMSPSCHRFVSLFSFSSIILKNIAFCFAFTKGPLATGVAGLRQATQPIAWSKLCKRSFHTPDCHDDKMNEWIRRGPVSKFLTNRWKCFVLLENRVTSIHLHQGQRFYGTKHWME